MYGFFCEFSIILRILGHVGCFVHICLPSKYSCSWRRISSELLCSVQTKAQVARVHVPRGRRVLCSGRKSVSVIWVFQSRKGQLSYELHNIGANQLGSLMSESLASGTLNLVVTQETSRGNEKQRFLLPRASTLDVWTSNQAAWKGQDLVDRYRVRSNLGLMVCDICQRNLFQVQIYLKSNLQVSLTPYIFKGRAPLE